MSSQPEKKSYFDLNTIIKWKFEVEKKQIAYFVITIALGVFLFLINYGIIFPDLNPENMFLVINLYLFNLQINNFTLLISFICLLLALKSIFSCFEGAFGRLSQVIYFILIYILLFQPFLFVRFIIFPVSSISFNFGIDISFIFAFAIIYNITRLGFDIPLKYSLIIEKTMIKKSMEQKHVIQPSKDILQPIQSTKLKDMNPEAKIQITEQKDCNVYHFQGFTFDDLKNKKIIASNGKSQVSIPVIDKSKMNLPYNLFVRKKITSDDDTTTFHF